MYRNETDLCELILCPVLILAFIMFYHIHWWTVFSGGVFWIFCVLYHVICKQWQLYLFFSNLNFFHFSSLIAVDGTHTILFRKSGKSGHLCLVSDLRRNAFCFSSLSMTLAVGLSYMAFIMLKYVSPMSTFWRFFKIINGCSILSKAFFGSTHSFMVS